MSYEAESDKKQKPAASATSALRELHRLHQQLGDVRDRLERGPKQIKAREVNLVRLEADLAQVKADAKTARVGADQKQLLLKTSENKIADLKTKLNQASSNREYQALKDQIAADEMAGSVLADEILEALERIDQFTAAVATAEQTLVKGKEDLAKVRQQVAQQHDSLAVDLARLEGDLKTAEAVLPSDFRDAYYRVVKSRGSDAMAQVEGGTCTGCHQQITQNMHNALLMGRTVFCQGSCGRLLYLPEDRSPGAGR
ncbi:MAG: phospholipase [Planctomycetia bacterium]|nr:phospholipase [Planctomycetia bacterium]